MARTSDRVLDEAISRATLELLAEVGFDRLSIAGVAARARTARTSVYRRWPDKTELVAAAVRHSLRTSDASGVDTGSLRGDLLAHAGAFAARAEILPGLVVAIRDSGPLGKLVRENVVERDRELMTGIIARAAGRGEVRADVEPIVLEVPLSAMFTRVLLLDDGLTEDYLVALMDQVVLPLLAREGPER